MIALIAAVAKNGVIGRDGDLPWRLSTDLKRFKALTLGHTLVMGRATYDSIGRPLPGRKTVVLTRNPDWRAEGVEVAHSVEAALDREGEVFVAGGAQVYALSFPHAAVLHLSLVDAAPKGDTVFPEFDAAEWGVAEEEFLAPGPRDDHAHRYYRLVRPRGALPAPNLGRWS